MSAARIWGAVMFATASGFLAGSVTADLMKPAPRRSDAPLIITKDLGAPNANLECNELGSITLQNLTYNVGRAGRPGAAAIYLSEDKFGWLSGIFGCEDLTR